MQETWVQCLGQEDPLEKGMATCSPILAWRIPWAEEPGRPRSMGREKDQNNLVSKQHQLHSACVHAKLLQSCRLFATLWTIARQIPLSMGFSRQEYRSRLPCPPPGDLPGPGSEPASLMSPALPGGSLPLVPPGKPTFVLAPLHRWENRGSPVSGGSA